MPDSVKVDWRVPSDEWQTFREVVEDGEIRESLGDAVESAMIEYADSDRFAEAEESVNRIVDAMGHLLGESFKEKKTADDADKTRVTVRVDDWVKTEFREMAKDASHSYGEALATALREYRQGGRAERIVEKLERIEDDAIPLMKEANSDSEDGLSPEDRKVITIASKIKERWDSDDEIQIMDDDLVGLIDEYAGRGQSASEPTREKYRELIVERLDLVPHPNNAEMWVRPQVAEQYRPEGQPEIVAHPVDFLDHDEKRRRIALEALREAISRPQSAAKVTASRVQSEVLDDEVSRSTTLTLLEELANDVHGFELESASATKLQVDVEGVVEAPSDYGGLFQTANEYHRKGAPALLSRRGRRSDPQSAAATDGGFQPE